MNRAGVSCLMASKLDFETKVRPLFFLRDCLKILSYATGQ